MARHFIWQLYLGLAERGGMTEKQGRQLIKDLLPQYADDVDSIIANFGQTAKLDAKLNERTEKMIETEESGLQSLNMNVAVREALRASRSQANQRPRDENGRFVNSESSEGDTDTNPVIQPKRATAEQIAQRAADMNKVFQDSAFSSRVPVGRDPITDMRIKRGLIREEAEA